MRLRATILDRILGNFETLPLQISPIFNFWTSLLVACLLILYWSYEVIHEEISKPWAYGTGDSSRNRAFATGLVRVFFVPGMGRPLPDHSGDRLLAHRHHRVLPSLATHENTNLVSPSPIVLSPTGTGP